jgi:hypothetical protein
MPGWASSEADGIAEQIRVTVGSSSEQLGMRRFSALDSSNESSFHMKMFFLVALATCLQCQIAKRHRLFRQRRFVNR